MASAASATPGAEERVVLGGNARRVVGDAHRAGEPVVPPEEEVADADAVGY